MSSSSILFANRGSQWRDVFNPLRQISILASYSCRDQQISGPPPRADQSFAWNNARGFEIRPTDRWYSTAMRSSCCGCNWYTIDGIDIMDSTVTIVPPWDPEDPNDGVYFGSQLISKDNLLFVPGFEDLEPSLTASNYLLIECSFASWFMANVGNYYQEMINPDDPSGPPISRPWTTQETIGGGVDRNWQAAWTQDCGIFTAFPADRRSEAGCVRPVNIGRLMTIDATDMQDPPEYRLTGSFGITIRFDWAS